MTDNTFLSHFLTEDIYLIEGKTKDDQLKTDDKFAVITHLPLSDQDQKLLFKIFASVKINNQQLDLQDIRNFNQHPVSFFFGVVPPGLDPEYYKIIKSEDSIVIVAHSLSDIAQDDTKKRDLWKVLKSCFT